MTKEEATKRIFELHDHCLEELDTYYAELEKQGKKRYGLDGPKTEIEKKYDRLIHDIIAQIDN